MNKIICLLLLSVPASALTSFSSDPETCMEGPVAQFGRYVGDWHIDDLQLSRDGASWDPGGGERWVFECIGNGTAVQDYWLPANGSFGTNLRSYNSETGMWEIVWAATGVNGLVQISAEVNDDGDIVMDILSPTQNPPRRIIFFEPDENGWDWVQQWSFDNGTTWTDVYKIRATPWNKLD